MISFISFLMYLSFFILCLGIEIKRNKKWNNIFYSKSRLNSKGITTIYCISFVYMTFFIIINLIIGVMYWYYFKCFDNVINCSLFF